MKVNILDYIDKMQVMYGDKDPSSMAQEPRNMADGGAAKQLLAQPNADGSRAGYATSTVKTKKFATGERQSIHQKTLDDGSVVRVTEDVDDGAVRVEYQSEQNVFGDDVLMEYKKPLPDEGNPNPAAQFYVAESGPVGRQVGPDDYDMDIDEVGGSSIRDLDSDVSKLEEYATGKKPTMKEFVKNKKRKDKAKRITNDPEAQSDAIVRRQGEMLDYDVPDDAFASGGIARMLGE